MIDDLFDNTNHLDQVQYNSDPDLVDYDNRNNNSICFWDIIKFIFEILAEFN